MVSQWHSSDNRGLLYVTCVMHAVMLTRHCYGWHGNNKWYTIHEATLDHALQYALTAGWLEKPFGFKVIQDHIGVR